MNKKKIETNIEKLESQGYRIIDIVAGDIRPTKELQYMIDKIVKETSKGKEFGKRDSKFKVKAL